MRWCERERIKGNNKWEAGMLEWQEEEENCAKMLRSRDCMLEDKEEGYRERFGKKLPVKQ